MKKHIMIFGAVMTLLVALSGIAPQAGAQVMEYWGARYNGVGDSTDWATDIAEDAWGNVFVTGYSYSSATGYDYATVKYDPEGTQLWVAKYNGPGNGEDKATALAVDGAGNVYVTGHSDALTGTNTNFDYATIKYAPDGDTLWVARLNSGTSDLVQDLALDGDYNVCITGYSDEDRYFTAKYSTLGQQLWATSYDITGTARAYAITAGADWNVYVTGYGAGNYVTVKYNSGGVMQWSATYNGVGGGDDCAWDVAVDANWNVYVTGYSDGLSGTGVNNNYATIKYNSAGVQQWAAIYNGPGNDYDEAKAVAVSADGDVYVTGLAYNGSSFYDYATLKYNPAGQQQWVTFYNGPGNGEDQPVDLALDAGENAYVAGFSDGAVAGVNFDYATLKYDDSLGTELWEIRYNGPGIGEDKATAMALSENGEVFVTGASVGVGTDHDYATIKYLQVSPPGITVTLTPHDPPILIPAAGGSFQFDLRVQNTTPAGYNIDVWTSVTSPDGSEYAIVQRPNLTLPPGGNIFRPNLTQYVPASALPGLYTYHAYVRDHNTWQGLAEDSFTFEKLAGLDSPAHDMGWALVGWGEDEVLAQMPETCVLHQASPNPFNPTTVARYELRDASYVSLQVYDTAGRLVATLVNGWRDAGAHEVMFNASDLAAGVYIARLQAGEFVGIQKMVLIK